MSRKFQDSDFLVWEAYASGGAFGFSADAKIVFHCLSDRRLRARFIEQDGDQADAERLVQDASPDALRDLFERAVDLP